jgi:hypothetical protein
MAGQDFAVSSLLEIEDAQRVAWGVDDVRGIPRALGKRALLQEARDSAERGDIGAGGHELEQLATRCERRMVHHCRTL